LVDCTAITEVQNSDVDKMKGVIEITILSFHSKFIYFKCSFWHE